MSIGILKLVSGDDIIGEMKALENGVSIKDPASLKMFPSEDGGMAMALIPWCPYSDQESFFIKNDHIITPIEAPEELKNEYSDKFGSGIVTPPSQEIII